MSTTGVRLTMSAQGSECRLIDTNRPVGQSLCEISSKSGTSMTIADDQIWPLVFSFGLVLFACCALAAAVAFRLGYKRACQDLSSRRPAGIIRRADDYHGKMSIDAEDIQH